MVNVNDKQVFTIDETSIRILKDQKEEQDIVGTFRNGGYIEWYKGSNYFATWFRPGKLLNLIKSLLNI